ncbi:MAG: hypothetical protein JRJ69_00500 [Deltaproteobacteria bacterium]|nr:hypothetical protein [Deltaproteobacteria bacterium]MBW1736045.1 hypothetical protein [Deltaproteobacteria bacterium]MBW2032544.1 hypothetical protein [Deltaproteobacteria bacterium]MBW2113673.1 hypothetical protein [Deltaproteobacteria bacterium]MBW2167934.1 hypothetical protein [Deltaproteobacteria bacterium]
MGEIQYDYEAIFIDVGQGDATVITRLSNMHSVLIDAAVGNPVISVLKDSEVLQAIFITHWHKDHIDGMHAVLNWLAKQQKRTVNVYINPQDSSTITAKNLRRTLDEKYNDGIINLKPAFEKAESSLEIINGKFRILWPRWKEIITKPDMLNLGSLIILFKVGAINLLFGGDAGGDVWPQIDKTFIEADIFKYPHHAGKLHKNENDWTADNLISKVKPEWVISSVGKKKQHGHPSKEFISTKSRYPKIHFLDTTEGNINLQIESATKKISIRK